MSTDSPADNEDHQLTSNIRGHQATETLGSQQTSEEEIQPTDSSYEPDPSSNEQNSEEGL